MDIEYLKKVGIYVLSAVLSVCILCYFGYHVWHSFTKEIETAPATKVTFEQTIECEGYVFRTETPLSVSGSAQSVVPTVSEGEHIRKSGEVARLYSGYSPDTVSKIALLEEKIELFEGYGKGGNASLKDTSSIDREIYSILSEMRGSFDRGDAKDAQDLRRRLVMAVGERAALTGAEADMSAQIDELKSERQSLLSSMGTNLGAVYTPVSGYYYSECDGYEEVFSSDALSDITLKELRELLSASPLEAGRGGKTVTKSRWQLVCPIAESEKNTYKAGRTCTVRFKNSDLVLTMDVDQVLYDKEGCTVVLSTNVMPEGFDYARRQSVELVKTEYTGLRVPTTAVRMIGGETGVYILDVTVVSFRRVEVLYTADNYYVVKMPEENVFVEGEDATDDEGEEAAGETPALRLHDSVITEGKGLYEGRVIGD